MISWVSQPIPGSKHITWRTLARRGGRIGNVPVDLQKRLFKGAVDKLNEYGEPINHVLEVDLDGEEMLFDLYELPPATPGRGKK